MTFIVQTQINIAFNDRQSEFDGFEPLTVGLTLRVDLNFRNQMFHQLFAFKGMFNNMNIRHNNSTEGDKNYREVVAKMTQDELENWYDETYQLCLLAFLELDNVERTKKVAQLKASFGK